jgi:heptaprenyl diphosphate synthase
MDPAQDQAAQIKAIFESNGRKALNAAKQELLSSAYSGGTVSLALRHFANVTTKKALPVFPALTALSCKAAGGQGEKTVQVGAAMMLIAWAADIHDDVIDQSVVKYSKKTVYGKYGGNVAILAGDALLAQGFQMLSAGCEEVRLEQKNQLFNHFLSALFEISKAEAKETQFMGKTTVTAKQLLEIIKLKAVVPEVHCKVGAILGGADPQTVEHLGNYGHTYGVVSMILEEAVDLMDYGEFKNKAKNECLPLPLLYALQNAEAKKNLQPLIEAPELTRETHKKIVRLTEDSNANQKLKQMVTSATQQARAEVRLVTKGGESKELALLLEVLGQVLD